MSLNAVVDPKTGDVVREYPTATNEQIAKAIADPRVQGVSLTGSERAGAAVAEIAGRNLKKVLETADDLAPLSSLGAAKRLAEQIDHEELFGPVAMVFKVNSEDEAVELANDIPFGLGSYVFTTDTEQAKRVADKIDAGMVYVNLVGADGVELPLGGVKRSGYGRELGRFGIDEFVNKKLIRIG